MQAFFRRQCSERDLHDQSGHTVRKACGSPPAVLQREITVTSPQPAPEPSEYASTDVQRGTIPPVTARRVRFTIRETNSLEPLSGRDRGAGPGDRNVASADAGTRATSSGDTVVADRHELRHINDGRYGNSRSWMSSEKRVAAGSCSNSPRTTSWTVSLGPRSRRTIRRPPLRPTIAWK